MFSSSILVFFGLCGFYHLSLHNNIRPGLQHCVGFQIIQFWCIGNQQLSCLSRKEERHKWVATYAAWVGLPLMGHNDKTDLADGYPNQNEKWIFRWFRDQKLTEKKQWNRINFRIHFNDLLRENEKFKKRYLFSSSIFFGFCSDVLAKNVCRKMNRCPSE